MAYENLSQEVDVVWQACKDGKYESATKTLDNLLCLILQAAYTETKSQVSPLDRQRFEAYELKNFANGSEVRLVEWVKLFEELHILELFAGADQFRQLVKSFDVANIAKLSELSLKTTDEKTLGHYLAVILMFTNSMMTFMGVTWNTDPDIVDKKFSLDLSTGIMTNPTDQSRNVSFKAATFGVMLGYICSKLVSKSIDNYEMNGILYKSGYNAGADFGEALFKKMTAKMPDISSKDLIDRWCWFDTDVGWGKFENEVRLGNAPTDIGGKIILKFNFLATEKGRRDHNLCSLMKGYIAGVLDKLLGFSIQVSHDIDVDCSQSIDSKNDCEFYISFKHQAGNGDEVGK